MTQTRPILPDRTAVADFFKEMGEGPSAMKDLTDNGLHFTGDGYRKSAGRFLSSLGLSADGADSESLEPVRQAIQAKNELYFHRWRPQNETYLFGFRKHEQGKNGKEIAEFDPLVASAEAEIEKLQKK